MGPSMPGRVFYHAIWFRGHNNQRYEQLIPRLNSVDAFLFLCSDRRFIRGAQFRTLRSLTPVTNRLVFRSAARRYSSMLTTDPEQIPFFRGRVVVDVDDPRFTTREAQLLSRPSVVSYVVTHERAAEQF